MQYLYRHPNASDDFEKPEPKPYVEQEITTPDEKWRRIATAGYQCDRETHIAELANQLGVPQFALDELGFGFLDRLEWRKLHGSGTIPCDAWSWPERDAFGQVMGVAARLTAPDQDGNNKKFLVGSGRALCYSNNYLEPSPMALIEGKEVAPVLVVEGPTDTAALLALSVPVVGRMNNRHGVDQWGRKPQLLTKLFEDVGRPIVIICDNDPPKKNGSRPGFDGGTATAQNLANALHRPVYWAMPPQDAKDARTWLNECVPDAATHDREYLAVVGGVFLGLLEYHRIDPVESNVVEVNQTKPADEVSLKTYRDQMAQDRLDSLGETDLHVTRAGCGVGKSHVDNLAFELFDPEENRTAVIVPGHANAEAAVEEYRGSMPSIRAYPRITKDNCHPAKFPDVERARRLALAPSMSSCLGCEYQKGCEFKKQLKDAQSANHLVLTRTMATYQPKLLDDRDYISIHENPFDLFKGHLKVAPDDLDLLGFLFLECAAKEKSKLDYKNPSVDYEMIKFLESLEMLTAGLQKQAEALDSPSCSTHEVPTPKPFDYIPHQWERKLNRLAQGVMTDPSRRKIVQSITRDATELILKLATGRVERLVMQIDKPERSKKKTGNTNVNVVYIVAVWDQPELPHLPTKWIADATLRIDLLKELTTQKIIDKTPAGQPPRQHQVVQVPIDVTMGTSAHKVASILLSILDKHRWCSRFGLITHRTHLQNLFENPKSEAIDDLDRETKALFSKMTYFGSNADVGDNSWYKECDFLIVLGTPRPNKSSSATRLIVLGHMDAAADPDLGGWTSRPWETTTVEGHTITVEGYGFSHPRWQEAFEDIVHSRLIQSSGRTRSILDGGIPGLIATNEPLGDHVQVVDPNQYPMVSKEVQEATEAVRRYCASAIDISTIGKAQQRRGASGAHVAGEIGRSEGQTSRLLKRAESAGLVVKLPGRKQGWISARVARAIKDWEAQQKAPEPAPEPLNTAPETAPVPPVDPVPSTAKV